MKSPATDGTPTELRGVWIANGGIDVLGSRSCIGALQFSADHHVNAVYLVVWNDAQTRSQYVRRQLLWFDFSAS